LKSSNQQYQLTTESMAAKVRGLENDLAVARSTIRQLTGANHPASLQQQQQHQSQLIHQLQQQPQQQQFGTTDFGATMDADRLRQAQLQQLMFLQGGGGGSGSAGSASFNRHMSHANPGVAGFSHSEHDTTFLRQQQLLAAQQATSRDRAIMLQSNMSRPGNNAAMSSPNTHPNALLNTLANQPQPEFGLGDSRLLEGEMMRLPDALAEHQRAALQQPSQQHHPTSAAAACPTNQQQQILEFEEFLLRQQEQEQQQQQQRKSMG